MVDDILDSTRLHIDDSYYYRTLAMKQFEMTNHPGNACPNAGGRRVLATVTDRTTPVGTTAITAYKADVISAQYYYPFGSPMTKWESDTSYRYKFGFNGKENDYESDLQDYGMRVYNPALGRFLSVDPIARDFAWWTPYQFAGDMPIMAIDLDGLQPVRATTTVGGVTYSLKVTWWAPQRIVIQPEGGEKIVVHTRSKINGRKSMYLVSSNTSSQTPTQDESDIEGSREEVKPITRATSFMATSV